jgi:tetratricopeptide (TPR) repeat protein
MMADTASLWAAAKRFEGILRKDPLALSFAPLADIYRQLGLQEEALATARNGCKLHPDFAAGQMSLAKILLDCGETDEATKALEVVVRVTPENSGAQRLLAGLYTAAGRDADAAGCLAVASSLDMELPESAAPAALEMVISDEEIAEADILELSDELIEEENFAEPMAQFAASPERPSLGDAVNRAEPFMMATPPPFYDEEPVAAEPPPVMMSATIAELYVSQGFLDKGAAIYRELLGADPANREYEKRLFELTHPVKPQPLAQKEQCSEGVLEKLQEWLANIGRVRECRTSRL